MALVKQPPTTIPFTGGVNTKQHPHVLRPPEFTKLLNVDMHELGAIAKRRGFERFAEDLIDGSALPSTWDEVTSYGGKNLAFADGSAYEYVDSAGKLVLLDSDAVLARGRIEQVDRTPFANLHASDYAYINGFEVLVYGSQDTTAVMVFRDHATGAVLYVKNSEFVVNAARAVAFGTTLMVVTVEDDDGTASVKTYFIDTSSLPTSVSTSTVISDADTATAGALDVVADAASANAVAVYRKKSAAAVKVIEIDSSGSAGSSVTHASDPERVAIHQVEGNSDFMIAWDDGSTGNIEVYGVSSAFALQSTHSIFTSEFPSHMAIGNGTTGTRARVYFDDGSNTTYRECNGDGTTSGSTSRELFQHRLASKPFSKDGRSYITLANSGNSAANTPFDRTLIAMLVTEDAEVFEAVGWMMHELNNAKTFNTGSSVSAVYLAPNGEFTFSAVRSINILRDRAEGATFRASWQIAERGGVDSKGTMYFPGGGLYAGESMQAIGFPYRPEILTLTPQVGGGMDASKTYVYVAVYEYTDKTGQLHRSAPSTPVSVDLGGSDGTVDVRTRTLMDRDSDSLIILYRTQGNGTTFQRLTQASGATAAQSRASTAPVFDYADGEADSQLADNPILYSNSGAQVENYPPPATYVYMLHGNRLWAVDEDGNIAFSKELIEGVGPAFNPGFTISTRVIGERPVALVSRDTHFVVFWPKAIGYVHGDGPNAAGAGGQFTVPQIIEGSPVGCSNVNSIVEMPKGIMFEDAALGIYLLPSGAGQVPIFVGARIESERTGTIVGAELIKDREAVVFTQSDSKLLIYWYGQNKWSTSQLSPTDGGSPEDIRATAIWNERHVVAFSGATLGRERLDDVFRDSLSGSLADYHRTITTGWISLEQMLRLARVWRFNLLGERVDGQSVRLNLYRDFNDSLVESHVFTTSGSDPLILRAHVVNQKLKAIKVEIIDFAPEGNSGATKWTAMQLEWGAKNRGPRVNRDNGDAS